MPRLFIPAVQTRSKCLDAFAPPHELWCIRRAPWLPPFEGTTCYDRERDDI